MDADLMGNLSAVPDFDSPPLDEVVVGVQFATPLSYSTVYANAVWQLYREEFPIVTEHPQLNPHFEVFGGNPEPRFEFGFGQPPLRNRLWFISEDDSHLIQFQDDRLLLNWRNRANGTPYPRHEKTQRTFAEYLKRLDALFKSEFNQGILINQAEVSYINIIPVQSLAEMGDWLRFTPPPAFEIEGVNSVFGEVVRNDMHKPVARLTCETHSVTSPGGKQNAFRLTLSYRGAPSQDSVDSAMEFISSGRTRIVKRFCDITTESAQLSWGRN